jgi:cytoskeleton protein RodZ
MTSVGSILKAERERQGREVAGIAEELCIMQRYLRAIEQDDLKSLPGTFFYKSFVKQYAAILSVDEMALQAGVDRLTAESEPPAQPGGYPLYAMPDPDLRNTHLPSGKAVRDLDPIVQDGNRRYFPNRRIGVSLAVLGGVLLACSGFYGWYNKPQAPQTSAAPISVQTSALTEVKDVSSTPATGPSLDVTTTTGPDGVNHVVLNLSATETTWLSITSEGKQIFSGVLERSQTKTLTAAEVARMKVGNAGGIEVRWNGKPIGPIGPRGQVRTVLFTPENFQILVPTAPL